MRTEGRLPDAGHATKGGSLSTAVRTETFLMLRANYRQPLCAACLVGKPVSILRAFCFCCRSGYR